MLVVTAGLILFYFMLQVKFKRDRIARLQPVTVPVNIQALDPLVELQIEADKRRKQDEEDLRRARKQQSLNTNNPEEALPQQPVELNREAVRKLREIEDINRLNRRLKLERELKGLKSEKE